MNPSIEDRSNNQRCRFDRKGEDFYIFWATKKGAYFEFSCLINTLKDFNMYVSNVTSHK